MTLEDNFVAEVLSWVAEDAALCFWGGVPTWVWIERSILAGNQAEGSCSWKLLASQPLQSWV